MRRYVFAALLASSVSPASSARVVNGGFERSVPTTVTQNVMLSAGSTALPVWMINAGAIDLVSTYRKAADDRRSIEGDVPRRGGISTTVYGTTLGRSADLRFDMAASPAGRPNAQVIRVSAGLESALDASPLGGGRGSAMDWATTLFTATSTAVDQLLTFRAENGTGSGAAIDPTRIALQPVPLPATAPLAVLGMAALALFRRRKTAGLGYRCGVQSC